MVLARNFIWFILFGGEMTSPGGEVVGGEVTCGGEMVGGESSWWRDDWIPKIQHKLSNLMENLFLPVICTSCLLKGISGMQFSMQI